MDSGLHEFDTSAAQSLAELGPTALRVLELSGNELDSESISLIARSQLFANAVQLQLGVNAIYEDGVIDLAGCSHLSSLVELRLPTNRIGPVGVAALAKSPHLGSLTKFDLNNPIEFEGARALADSPHFSQLTKLRNWESIVSRIQIGDGTPCVSSLW